MSRSGYSDDVDGWGLIRWRGQVASAIRGKRGQDFLRELLSALDAMPEKRLIAGHLRQGGEVCAIGSVGAQRGVDLEALDTHDYDTLAATFGIAHQLVQEIEFMNDEGVWGASPEDRWRQMRAWVVEHLRAEPAKAA
jgi:hypothetical protein